MGAVPEAYPGMAALASGLGLETPRLVLRQFEERDLDPLAAMYADPETMRHLGTGATFSRGETWRAIGGMLGHWLCAATECGLSWNARPDWWSDALASSIPRIGRDSS